jgi:hypothetical protein
MYDLGYVVWCYFHYALSYRETRHERFATWRAVIGTPALA